MTHEQPFTKPPTHPKASEYPMMGEASMLALAHSIQAQGQRLPVIVSSGPASTGYLVDGRNRWRACEMAQVPPLIFQMEFQTEDEIEKFIEDANEHRRHLTPEQLEEKRRERRERIIEKAQEGKSLRVIAEETGASKSQVHRELAGVPRGTPEVLGSDGKTYPAQKPTPPRLSIQSEHERSDKAGDAFDDAIRKADERTRGARAPVSNPAGEYPAVTVASSVDAHFSKIDIQPGTLLPVPKTGEGNSPTNQEPQHCFSCSRVVNGQNKRLEGECEACIDEEEEAEEAETSIGTRAQFLALVKAASFAKETSQADYDKPYARKLRDEWSALAGFFPECPVCGGRGWTQSQSVPCRPCQGTGSQNPNPCPRCEGEGLLADDLAIDDEEREACPDCDGQGVLGGDEESEAPSFYPLAAMGEAKEDLKEGRLPVLDLGATIYPTSDKEVAPRPDLPTKDSRVVYLRSGAQDWNTPPKVCDLVRELANGSIYLDPCANIHSHVRAIRSWDEDDDGLSHSWWEIVKQWPAGDGLIFVNPPFDQAEKWGRKVTEEAALGAEIVLLTPARVGSLWYQEHVLGKASCVLFWRGRLKYWQGGKEGDSSTFDTSLAYYGSRVAEFVAVFGAYGSVIYPAHREGVR